MDNFIETMKAISTAPGCQVCMTFFAYAGGWVILYSKYDTYCVQAWDSVKRMMWLWDLSFGEGLAQFNYAIHSIAPDYVK